MVIALPGSVLHVEDLTLLKKPLEQIPTVKNKLGLLLFREVDVYKIKTLSNSDKYTTTDSISYTRYCTELSPLSDKLACGPGAYVHI
jgi:hypothetical protein